MDVETIKTSFVSALSAIDGNSPYTFDFTSAEIRKGKFIKPANSPPFMCVSVVRKANRTDLQLLQPHVVAVFLVRCWPGLLPAGVNSPEEVEDALTKACADVEYAIYNAIQTDAALNGLTVFNAADTDFYPEVSMFDMTIEVMYMGTYGQKW